VEPRMMTTMTMTAGATTTKQLACHVLIVRVECMKRLPQGSVR
jgi:hypothetical protein